MSGATPFVLLLPAVLGFFGMSAGFQTAGWPVEVSAAPAGRADSIGDTLWSFRAPSSWPTGLAWDGDRLWLGDNDSDSLYRLTTEGVVEAAFPLFDSFPSPAGMTWIGNNLWMVDENTSTLYEIDPATGTPLKSFPLPDTSRDPSSWGLAWDGNYLWHSEYAHGKIYQLDTTDGRVVSWFAPPDSWILGLEYDGQYLWGVSIRSNRAFLMSLPSGTLVQTYPWKVPYPLGLALVNGYMWCASGRTPSGTRRVYKVYIGQDAVAEQEELVTPGRLARAVPNPFQVRTRITVGHDSPAIVGVRVFDPQGRLVRSLRAESGALTWDGADQTGRSAPCGAYVVCVRFADGLAEQQPVVLAR